MRFDDYLSREKIGNEEFAGRLGVTPEAVRLWRLGKRTPRREIMERIRVETAGAVQANDFFATPSEAAE